MSSSIKQVYKTSGEELVQTDDKPTKQLLIAKRKLNLMINSSKTVTRYNTLDPPPLQSIIKITV
jgi:hypothetical protein